MANTWRTCEFGMGEVPWWEALGPVGIPLVDFAGNRLDG